MYHLYKIDKVLKKMKKQKVCIVGDGLTGLITALSLSRLNIDIHLIGKKHQIHKSSDNRTTALSPSNYSFLSKYFDKTDLKSFWPCKKIRLYNETSNNNSGKKNDTGLSCWMKIWLDAKESYVGPAVQNQHNGFTDLCNRLDIPYLAPIGAAGTNNTLWDLKTYKVPAYDSVCSR